jgi:hypothetical protein
MEKQKTKVVKGSVSKKLGPKRRRAGWGEAIFLQLLPETAAWLKAQSQPADLVDAWVKGQREAKGTRVGVSLWVKPETRAWVKANPRAAWMIDAFVELERVKARLLQESAVGEAAAVTVALHQAAKSSASVAEPAAERAVEHAPAVSGKNFGGVD